tara:strand:+ start:1331 stop:1864 length:534 start_codon:yes stop_codon:yes gene_type:complete
MIYKQTEYNFMSNQNVYDCIAEYPALRWLTFNDRPYMEYKERQQIRNSNNIHTMFKHMMPSDITNILPWILEYYEGAKKAEDLIELLRKNLIGIKDNYLNGKHHTFDLIKGTDIDNKITKIQHKEIIKFLKPWRNKLNGCSGIRSIDKAHSEIYISARYYFWAENIVPRRTQIHRGK